MAIAYVQETGKGSASGAAGTLVVSVTTAPAAGRLVVARIGFRGGGTVTVSSVTDTKGNTWTVHVQNNGANGHAAVATTGQDVGTLTTSDTITVTLSATIANGIAAIVDEFSGCDVSSSRQDSTQTGTAVTTARSAGSIVTTNANDLIVAAFCANGTETSFTKDAAYTDFTTKFQVATFGTNSFAEGEFQIVAATGTYTTPGTGGLSASSVGASVALKAAASGAITPAGVTGVATVSASVTFNPKALVPAGATGVSTVSATVTFNKKRIAPGTIAASSLVTCQDLSGIHPNIPVAAYPSLFVDRRGNGAERRDLWTHGQ